MNLQNFFDKMDVSRWPGVIIDLVKKNLLIKTIAVIITLTLFLVVKTNQSQMGSVWFKTVPVRAHIMGESPQDKTVYVEIEPKTVEIRGSEDRIRNIHYLTTEIIDISNRKMVSSIFVKIETKSLPINVTPSSVKAVFIVSPN